MTVKNQEPDESGPAAEREEEKTPTGRLRAWEKRRFRNGLLFAAAVILLYTAITNLNSLGGRIVSFFAIFSPLIIGVLLAMILITPLRGLERLFFLLKKKSKAKHKLPDKVISIISLTLTYLLAVLLLFFLGNSVVPQIVESFRSIVSSLESYYPQALSYLEGLGFETDVLREWLSKIDLGEIWKALTANATTIINTARDTVNGVFTALITILSAVIFSAYILANRDNLSRQANKLLRAYFRPATADRLRHIGKLVLRTFSKFFSGQCLEAVILGTIFFIAMTVFRFPYAIVISVIIAVTAIIPYFGAFISLAIGALLICMQSPMKALLFIVMFEIIQQLENHLIYPRVVGASVGLPAIWTFTALVAGGAMYGVVGMILFIPLASVLYSLLREDVNFRLSRPKGESEQQVPDGEAPPGPSSGE